MATSKVEVEMFERLAHNEPRLIDFFQSRFNTAVETLVGSPDEARLRIAQGRAQLAQEVLALLKPHRG